MPRFFNRIRKQLAKDNKFFQYSRYAIGEILLVVIGILIALQVNDWNQEQQLLQVEVSYLNKILDEFQSNEQVLLDQKQSLTLHHDRQEKLLALHQRGVPFELREMLTSIEISGFTASVKFKKEVWNDIYSTGNALVFQNDELQQWISSFYSMMQDYERLIGDLDSYRKNHRRLAKGVIDPESRVRMVKILVDSYWDPNSSTIPELGIEEQVDTAQIIERYRSVTAIGSELADLQMVTDVAIILSTNMVESEWGTTAIISKIQEEIASLSD